ncbi:MAG: GNAT family N-acetyltransferase [Anaerolineae bacterium]|nr:GNAT family N-acetyltransferase [Anaerolineae bacterium]
MSIQYLVGQQELLERVEPLWLKLNDIHLAHSNYFKHHYRRFTFAERCLHFTQDSATKLMVCLVVDQNTHRDVAYVICSISPDGTGEVDSLYVDAEYRKLGVGDQLMKQSLHWMDNQQVKKRVIAVAEGNEMVLPFYQRYGFFPRKVILEYINPDDE